jgi:predicted ATPase
MVVEAITNLTIKGYKSIRELENFELRRFNVFIGANGSGKSNVIDFFRMLNFMFSSTQGSLQLFIARKGRANSLLHYGSKGSRFIDASVQFDGDKQWSRYSFSLSWGAPDDLHFASELLEYQRDGKDATPRQKQLGSAHFESAVLRQADLRGDPALSTVAKIFRDRLRQVQVYHFHDTSDEANIRLSQSLDREDYLMGQAGNLAVFLHNLKENKPAHYKRILSTVQLVAPFIRDFVVEPQAANDRFVLLRWKDRSGETFEPSQLSDGTIRAIALITALLHPDEMMPSIMLFDEPELGLHPAAIGLIASLLKAAAEKRQVIVATQSPILIRHYSPDDVIVVERSEEAKGRGESTFKRLDASELESWLKDFDLGELYEKNVTGGGAQ